jgi:hypothetical protein
MPRFKIVPTDQICSSAEVTALDAGAVLNVVSQLNCGEADIMKDGAYAFSVRLARNGLWTLFQREPDPCAKNGRSFG